jgi:hypothetical protein
MPKDRPPSPRCTEKERFYLALFEDAEDRGVPLAQIAVENDISPGTLSWWKSEIRRRAALRRGHRLKGKNSRAEEHVQFIPIKVVPDEETLPAPVPTLERRCIEIFLPGGAMVHVPDDFDEAVLTRVARAISNAC